MQWTAFVFFWDVKSCRVKGTDVSEQHDVFIFGAEGGDNAFFRIVGTFLRTYTAAKRGKKNLHSHSHDKIKF